MSSLWVTKRALGLHLTLAIVLPGFGALTWWQIGRAISGNTLSYVYSFEWPLFAAYAVYLWWKLVHEAPTAQVQPHIPAGQGKRAPLATRGAGDDPVPRVSRPGAEDGLDACHEPVDDELAAYNRYLADLAASGPRKQLFAGRRGRRRSQNEKS